VSGDGPLAEEALFSLKTGKSAQRAVASGISSGLPFGFFATRFSDFCEPN